MTFEPRNTAQLPESTPIRRRKLSDEVLERLLGWLESGRVKPGDQLPSERELMATFQVGRPAVREALQALEQMGMVAISHGERARVISPTPATMFEQIDRAARHLLSTSPQTLEHLKEARLMFELGMVRLAARKATPEQIEHLRSLVQRLENARRSPGKEFLKADLAFHEAIAAISGNPIFAAVSRAMLQWLAEFHVELVRQPGAEDVTLSEHRAILERLAAHDEEGAAQMMSDHLTRASHLYRIRRQPHPKNAAN